MHAAQRLPAGQDLRASPDGWRCAAALSLLVLLLAADFAGSSPPGPERPPANQALLVLFVAISVGLLLGQFKVWGISLGMAGIFVSGLLLGHAGYTAPEPIAMLGVVLLMYGVGLGAGPMFFRAFGTYGKQVALAVVPMIVVGALVVVGLARLLGLPIGLAAGCFSGSMKNSASFASALDRLPGEEADLVAVGYGLSYPISLVLIVVFVQLAPRVLGKDVTAQNAQLEKERPDLKKICQVMIEVRNTALAGRKLSDLKLVASLHCRILGVLQGDRLVPAGSDVVCEPGLHVLVIGEEDNLPLVADYLGARSDKHGLIDLDHEQAEVVVTSRQAAGKSLGELNLLVRYGVTVQEVRRLGHEFVPRDDLVLHVLDVLQVAGPAENVSRFAQEAGNHAKALQQTDLLSLSLGIVLGMLLGSIPLGLPGSDRFTLGMAGGPLLVALILGHFGHVGKVAGHFPPATQLFLVRLGLALLLGAAAVNAGAKLTEVFARYGGVLILMTLAVNLTAVSAGMLASYLCGQNLLQALAVLCGGLSATPGYEALAAKADSDVVLVIFTTAYVMSMLLMVFAMEIVIAVLRVM